MVIELEKTPDLVVTNADALLDDPPPQDYDFIVEQVEVAPSGQSNKPTSPARDTDKPASPAKATDKPSSPMKAAGDKEDDIMITGVGHTSPGNPVALSKHSAKDELSAMSKGKWNANLSSYAHLNAQDIHSGFLNQIGRAHV